MHKEDLKTWLEEQINKEEAINQIKLVLYELSGHNHNPVDCVLWVPIDMVSPNDYNPNTVAKIEMGLLLKSIEHDGYTQPIVTIYDKDRNKYVIVDGFHRYFISLSDKATLGKNMGMVPIVMLKKGLNDRMASTVRHNRARGKHSIKGMSSMVFKMKENGWADEDICNELGMQPEELIKIKHITGFSKLFENHEYNKAWVTKNQLLIAKKWNENNNTGSK